MAAIRQPSFAGGELAPTLHGRTDLEQYASGLRRCRNFFISHHGAAVSRPGMTYEGTAKWNGPWPVRLVPFIYSDETAYVLEFGNTYVRFYYNGAPLMDGVPVEVASPFLYQDLPHLKFSQSGDVLTITNPSGSYPAYELVRTSHYAWTLREVTFDVPTYFSQALPGGGWSGGGGIEPWAIAPVPVAAPTKNWLYKVTLVLEYEDGLRLETDSRLVLMQIDEAAAPEPLSSALPELLSPTASTPLTLHFEWPTIQTSGRGFRQVATRVYRGRGGLFGLIGEVAGPQVIGYGVKFIDYGDEPDYTRAPPEGRNPFAIYKDDTLPLEVLRTEVPLTVGFFEQRMVFGGTAERPGRLWLSATNDYLNFDNRQVLTADGPIEIELASRRREEIRSILGLERLLVFTDAAVWAVGGAGGAPIAPTDLIEARVQSEVGASWVDPLVIEGSVLFVRAKGTGVRDLAYSTERRGYAGGDLSVLAQHLFDGFSVVEWCYAEDPHGLIWAVRSDGKLLSLTYSPAQGLLAWALHETDGFVESVCAIPATTHDEVYLAVRRTNSSGTVRFIERLAPRTVAAVADAICLDASTTFTAPESSVLTGLGHLEGKTVYALADGAVMGPFVVTGSQIDLALETPPALVHVGLRFTAELELLDLAEAREKQKTVKRVLFDVEASRGLWAGEDFDHLTEWRQRAVADAYGAMPLFTGQAEVRIGSTWNRHGRAVLRQVDPLPITVVGVTREGEAGGP